METKKCSKCGIEKPLNEFYNKSSNKDGLQCQCKSCVSEHGRKYRQRPGVKEEIAKRCKKYSQQNKKKRSEYNQKYYLENKEAAVEYQREYYLKNKEKVAKRGKIYYQQNKEIIAEKTKVYNRLSKYGINEDQWQQILNDQGGMCAICRELLDNGKNTCVDHDHETGKVRGVLCNNCNKALGGFKDNPEIIMNAIKYLFRVED